MKLTRLGARAEWALDQGAASWWVPRKAEEEAGLVRPSTDDDAARR
jgi:hypothetical protein